MIPLWINPIRPEQSTWGWALTSAGRPWVPHRVWPMPAVAPSGASSARLTRSSSERVPLAARARHRPPPSAAPTSARPAESYPRYSRRAKPSRRTPRIPSCSLASSAKVSPEVPPESARAGAEPVVIPIMPHMTRQASVPARAGGSRKPAVDPSRAPWTDRRGAHRPSRSAAGGCGRPQFEPDQRAETLGDLLGHAVTVGLDHHPYQRLGPTGPQQHPPGVAEPGFLLGDGRPHRLGAVQQLGV